MQLIKSIVYINISLFIAFSCDTKTNSKGEFDRILIFGDENVYSKLKESIDSLFSQEEELPAFESRFLLDYKPFSEFDIYKEYRNLMFVSASDYPTEINKLRKQLLPAKAQDMADNGENNIFIIKDLYALNQRVFMFFANDLDSAPKLLNRQISQNPILAQFTEDLYQRMTESLKTLRPDNLLMQSLEDSLGFSLYIPESFKRVNFEQNASYQFALYFYNDPVQFIAIYSFNSDDYSYDNHEIFSYRDDVMAKYLSGDKVDRENKVYESFLVLDSIRFKRIQSSYVAYEDSIIIGGGPFINYSYYDELNEKVYMIDAHIYNPGKRKSEDLFKLEALMRTFRILEKNK